MPIASFTSCFRACRVFCSICSPNHPSTGQTALSLGGDQTDQFPYQVLLDSPLIRRVYLEDLAQNHDRETPALELVRLILAKESEAMPMAQRLLKKAHRQVIDKALGGSLINLIETILVYKLPRLSREEIQNMLDLKDVDLKQTRFYQDVFAEGRQEGRQEGREAGRKATRSKRGPIASAQSSIELIGCESH